MIRGVLGTLVGAIVLFPAFFTLARLLFAVWPAYAERAAVWIDSGSYEFTAPMSLFNVVFWLIAEALAGGVAVLVARRRESAWVLAALVMLFMSGNHLYAEWDRFPWWYNLAVALPSGLAVLLGGMLAGRSRRPAPAHGVS